MTTNKIVAAKTVQVSPCNDSLTYLTSLVYILVHVIDNCPGMLVDFFGNKEVKRIDYVALLLQPTLNHVSSPLSTLYYPHSCLLAMLVLGITY